MKLAHAANDQAINAHYGRAGLGQAILDALTADGKDIDALTPDDLAPVDQFHIRGKPATLDLAQRAGLSAGMQVIDVGGGLGGPARLIAGKYGCDVTVLDATEEYFRAGEMLTARTHQGELVRFQHGNALEMPFADASFGVAWMQHVSPNIRDKRRLFSEIHRVLRPRGRLALYEVAAGKVMLPYLPVPWASDTSTCALETPDAMRALITGAGFVEALWSDESARALAWFKKPRPTEGERSPLGQHLLFGPVFGEMVRNVVRNLEEGRISVIMAVFERSEESMTERVQIEFPCSFPIKAIGRDTDDFEAVVTEIVRRHVPNLAEDAITRRSSARSNYLAVTANIVASSQEQLDALYRELSGHKQVLFLL